MFIILFPALVLQRAPSIPASEYLMILAQAVRVSEQDARASAQPGMASGPLMIQSRSVIRPTGVNPVGPVDNRDVARVLPRGVQLVDEGLVNCDPPGNSTCAVRDNGVWMRLDSLKLRDGVMEAFITSATTFHRTTSATCHRGLLVRFKKSGAQWTAADSIVFSMC